MDFAHSGGWEIDNMNDLKSKLYAGGAISGALLVSAGASAAVVDVTTVSSSISDAATAGGTIGLAVLAMYFGIKLYKWVKQAG
jgi:hypothetical protein